MGEEDIKMESWLWNVVELKKKNSLKAIWLIKVIPMVNSVVSSNTQI